MQDTLGLEEWKVRQREVGWGGRRQDNRVSERGEGAGRIINR